MKQTYHIDLGLMDRSINIWLIGVGGNGSEMLDILARMHMAIQAVGHIYGFNVKVWDGDSVSQSNIVRQRFWPADIGHNKALLSVERFNAFLGLDWHATPNHFKPSYLGDYSRPDILITCVDSAELRVKIAKQRLNSNCSEELLWLDMGNGEYSGQVVLGHLSQGNRKCVRLPHVFDLFPDLATIMDDDTPSCSAEAALAQQTFGINKTITCAAGNLLWALLTQHHIDHHGVYINSRANISQPIKIDKKVWQSYGYK